MKNNKQNSKLLIAISLSLLSSVSYADWGARLGTSNDYKQYDTKNSHARVFLSPQYRGEKFNIDFGRSGMSYDFTHSKDSAFEAIIISKEYGYKASDDRLFKGMSKRKNSVDLGARGVFTAGGILKTEINATKDVNVSKGFSAEIKLDGMTPHAAHNWQGKKTLRIVPIAGLRYQSSKMANYYYGVKSSEATANRKAYKAKSAYTPYIGLEAQAELSSHITIDAGLTLEKKAKSIRNSPLTNNKKYGVGANLGISYWFK